MQGKKLQGCLTGKNWRPPTWPIIKRSVSLMDKIKVYHFHNGKGGGVLSVIKNLLRFSDTAMIENHIIYTINEAVFHGFSRRTFKRPKQYSSFAILPSIISTVPVGGFPNFYLMMH